MPSPRRYLWHSYAVGLFGVASSVLREDWTHAVIFFVASGFVYLNLQLTKQAP